EYLKMNPRTLLRKARKAEIPAIKIGRQFRFDKEQIEIWLSHQTVGRPLNILIIDDDPIIRQLFTQSLEEFGHKIITSPNGIEALEFFTRRRFDLIFLDLLMPEIDGAEIFGRIRQIDKQIPVVIITGYPNSEVMKRATVHGPFIVMGKPFTADDILNAISSFIRSVETKT
ncbi:response regulator, partial [Chloroflexota bacterium]